MYMGGLSYWWVDTHRKLIMVTVLDTWWGTEVSGWNGSVDTLENVVKESFALAVKKERKETLTKARLAAKAKKKMPQPNDGSAL